MSEMEQNVKWLFDRLVSLILLVLLSPLFAVLACLLYTSRTMKIEEKDSPSKNDQIEAYLSAQYEFRYNTCLLYTSAGCRENANDSAGS